MVLPIRKPLAAAAASLAALSLAATPAAAAALPRAVHGSAPAMLQSSSDYYGHRWRHHDDDIDAGDVIAGILVIGGIAAIASAASSHKSDNTRYRNTDYRPQDNRQRYDDPTDYNDQGLSRAVDMCTQQVERGRYQVSGVDHASRGPDGWLVSGSVRDGREFTCRIGNDGRLEGIDIGRGDDDGYSAADDNRAYRSAEATAPGQLSNEAYARARAEVGTASPAARNADSQSAAARPAYPGGPVPGEPSYATAPEPHPQAQQQPSGTYYDGRYATAQSPDFSQTAYSPAG